MAPVGCSVMAYNYFSCDMVEAPRPRPGHCDGLKRALPDNVIFTYQGDGDLGRHRHGGDSTLRRERGNITVIFVNNAIYGMTGGQMAELGSHAAGQLRAWMRENMLPYYPLGVYRDVVADGFADAAQAAAARNADCPVAHPENAPRARGCAMSEPKTLHAGRPPGSAARASCSPARSSPTPACLRTASFPGFPYGPEMRGGTANCSVCISDDTIGSPLVLNPDVLVVMNQPSLDKFEHSVQPGGLVIVDSTLVPRIPDMPGVTVCAVPATALAEEAGLKGSGQRHLGGQVVRRNPLLQRGRPSARLWPPWSRRARRTSWQATCAPWAGCPGIVCD